MKFKKLVFIVPLMAAFSIYGQKIRLIQGSLDPLKGQTAINTEFVYGGILVTDRKTEEEYLSLNKEALNKKEAGRGDKWEHAWYIVRSEHFEPQFRDRFAMRTGMSTEGTTNKYTVIFHATRYIDDDFLIDTGMDADISRDPAYLDADVSIVETENRDHVVAKLRMEGIAGRASTSWNSGAYGVNSSIYEVRVRVGIAYAKAGDVLGAFISHASK